MDDVYQEEAEQRGEVAGRVGGDPMDTGADRSYDTAATESVDMRQEVGKVASVDGVLNDVDGV